MEEILPPGFRFYPTEEELISFYLNNKLEGIREDLDRVIPVLYIYDFNPWDLPQFAGERCRGDSEQYFFFIRRQEREARGGRPNRLTTSGYWKATGSPGYVYSNSTSTNNNRVIGMKRTMVFYKGRAPTGIKTEWKMNEYKAIEGEASSSTTTPLPKLRQEYSLCRVYKNSKCLRAFDRRPSAASALAGGLHELQNLQAHDDHEATTTSSIQNHVMMEMIRTSSPEPESSSSGEHGNINLSQTGPGRSENWDMVVDNEPMWDLDQLNWF